MKNLLIIILGLSGAFSFGQQEMQFTNSINNPYYLNPAAGGMTDVMQFELMGRTQWVGYNGGPRTFMVTSHSQINVGGEEKVLSEYNVADKALFALPKVTTGKIKHVVGGKVLNDAIGPFSKTSAYASYAIHLPFVKSFNFGVGLGLGFSNFRLDESRVVLHQADDASYAEFLGNASTQNIADANAGIVFYNENLFVGLSTSQFLNNKVNLAGIETGSTFARHYFITSKYRFESKGAIAVEPGFVGKITAHSPMSFDLGARVYYNEHAYLGIQYRTSNAIVVQIGSTLVKNLYVAYGYEHTIGGLQNVNTGTHEIQLGLLLGNNRNMDKEIKENIQKIDGEEGALSPED